MADFRDIDPEAVYEFLRDFANDSGRRLNTPGVVVSSDDHVLLTGGSNSSNRSLVPMSFTSGELFRLRDDDDPATHIGERIVEREFSGGDEVDIDSAIVGLVGTGKDNDRRTLPVVIDVEADHTDELLAPGPRTTRRRESNRRHFWTSFEEVDDLLDEHDDGSTVLGEGTALILDRFMDDFVEEED